MVDDWPFVSIIVPVYNGSHMIDALLTSLLALDYPADRHEILIVDNKSTDDTRERVQRYPVTLLEETEIQSAYAARNRGIEAAKGEILAFTDADCVVEPTWLKRLLADYEEPCWGGFAGDIEAYPPSNLIERYCALLNLPSRKEPVFQPASMGERLCSRVRALDYRSHIPLPAGLVSPLTANIAYRRTVFERIGYFDQRMTSGGDIDLAWRLLTRTDWRIAIVPNAVVYHQHRTNLLALVSMFRKYGGGIAALALKYGDDPERIARQLMAESLLLMVLAVPSHVFRILALPLRAIGRRSDVLFWFEPFLALMCALHHRYGRLEGVRRGRQWMGRSEVQPAHNSNSTSEGKAL